MKQKTMEKVSAFDRGYMADIKTKKKMYSEEEVKSILLKTDRFLRADLDIWFEQFNKNK